MINQILNLFYIQKLTTYILNSYFIVNPKINKIFESYINIIMKKLIIAAIALTGLYACDNTNKSASSFEITGNLTNTKGESIYLEKLGQQGANVIDSAVIGEKGDFKMNHYSPSVGFYRLRINASNFAMLVLDSSQKVVITGDARDLGNTYKAEGSPDTKLYLEVDQEGPVPVPQVQERHTVRMTRRCGHGPYNRPDSSSQRCRAPCSGPAWRRSGSTSRPNPARDRSASSTVSR